VKVGLDDLLVLLGAVAFAVQVVLLSHRGPGIRSIDLALLQMAVCFVVFTAAGVPSIARPTGVVWFGVVITGVFASALAFPLQAWAQTKMSATRAALIMAMEPAWALLFAVLLAGQHLNLVQGWARSCCWERWSATRRYRSWRRRGDPRPEPAGGMRRERLLTDPGLTSETARAQPARGGGSRAALRAVRMGTTSCRSSPGGPVVVPGTCGDHRPSVRARCGHPTDKAPPPSGHSVSGPPLRPHSHRRPRRARSAAAVRPPRCRWRRRWGGRTDPATRGHPRRRCR